MDRSAFPRPSGACAAVLALAMAVPAWAASSAVTGSEVASATTERNAYAAGGEVRTSAPVQGDLMSVGGRIVVDQPVGGDATLAAGAVDVRAPIGDDLRVAGGDVAIENTVGGELFAAGGNVAVRAPAVVARQASVHGGSVTLEGRFDGDVRADGQKVTLNGDVKGNVHLAGEQIELGPRAHIAGNLAYASGAEIRRDAAAEVTGTITREPASATPQDRAPARGNRGTGFVGGVFSYLAFLACAAVFLLVVPRFSEEAPRRIQASPWLALGIGFATLVAVPVLAVLLFITLFGIPLGIAVMALYPVLLLTGFLVGVLSIARLLPAALRQPPPDRFARLIAYFAGALLLIMLVARVPFVGGLALAVVSLAGIGACVLELYERRRGPGAPGPSQQSMPVTPVSPGPA
jgi:cytoskeletal protein CcmA (bactofilin family)